MKAELSLGLLFAMLVVSGPKKEGSFVPAQSSAEHPFGQMNPSAPPETVQWGQLAGVWDCTIRGASTDSAAKTSKATWTWMYTLDGHAVRDTYVGEERTDGRPTFRGTALRIYNPALEKWEIAWIDNASSMDSASKLKLFEATYQDHQIVMRYRTGNPSWRTVFFDISADKFEWRNEPSGLTMTCVRIQ